MTRIFTVGAVLALLLALVAGDAEGQQRRRRRPRPRPAPAAEPSEPSEPTPADVEPAPEAAPAAGAPEPASAAQGGTATQGAPAEAAPEPAPAAPAPDPLESAPDVGPVRAELESLMNELVETRSRIAVLGRQLFETRVRVRVQNRTGDDQILDRLDVRLDGAPVFDASRGLEGLDDPRQISEGFAAPGPHVLLVSLEQRARADEEYRYTQNDTFRFQVVRGKLTEITVVLGDRSDIAEEFADDGEGKFDVRTRVHVATRELGDE